MKKSVKNLAVLGLSMLMQGSLVYAAENDTAAWAKKYPKQLKQTQQKVKERILKDLETVEMAMGELPLPSDEKKPVFDELKKVEAYAEQAVYPAKLKGFRTIIPFNAEHAKIFKAWSMILRDKSFKGLYLWHINRFAPFKLFDLPQKQQLKEISLTMMRNEQRSQAINLTNCTPKQLTVKLALSDIPAGAKVRVFHTVFVDKKKLKAMPSALLPAKQADGGWSFRLDSGLTTQVWLMIDSQQAKAGKYALPLKITAGATVKNIKFKLNIAPVTFPNRDQMVHNLNMFDGVIAGGRGFSSQWWTPDEYKNLKKAALKDLDEHLLTGYSMGFRSSQLPSFERNNFDANGNLITKPSLDSFKQAIAQLPKNARYYIYFMVLKRKGGDYSFADFPAGSVAGKNALTQWIKYFAAACKNLNIAPKKVVLMPYDEPRSDEALKAAYDCLKVIKDNSNFTTFCTTGARGAKNPYCEKSITVTDIVQTCRRHVNEQFGKRKKIFTGIPAKKERELWIYDCGYKTTPLFYLSGAWQDALWGATGTGYWAYCDNGDNPGNWNMYPRFRRRRDNYAPQYFDASGITISREWEAIREGVENCEYMHMLRKKNPQSALLKSKVPKTLDQVRALRLKVLNELEK